MKNKIIPLRPNTQLTKNIVIESFQDAGSTCYIYKVLINNSVRGIVKEYFPKAENIHRDGYKIVVCEENSEEIDEIKKKTESIFNAELINTTIANTSGESNSIYSFNTIDITNDILNDGEEFKGTLTHYLLVDTCAGLTLNEYVKEKFSESGPTLSQVIILTKKILQSLEAKHRKNIIHLDIHPGNIYFATEPKKCEDTICIILDYGASQIVKNAHCEYIPIDSSFTEGFSSTEVRKAFEYRTQYINCPDDVDACERFYRCTETFSFYSDLYSVGMIFLYMLKDGNFNTRIVNSSETENELAIELYSSLNNCEKIESEFILNEVLRILKKALYPSKVKSKLEQNRYTSCKDFIDDLDNLMTLINQNGISAEIIGINAISNIIDIYQYAGIDVPNNKTPNEIIKDSDLFDSNLFAEAHIIRNNDEGKYE